MTNLSLVEESLSGKFPFDEIAIKLHSQDNVAILKKAISAGAILTQTDSDNLTIKNFIPAGHKVALKNIESEQPIYRYGQIIAFSSAPILAGAHVHNHNVGMQDFVRDYSIEAQAPLEYIPKSEQRTFMGFKRANGQVGTRNFIAVISSVNCSAHTSNMIARHFTKSEMVDFPNVDGVIALTHSLGCASRLGGLGYRVLQRTLAGMAQHPNIAGVLMVGLGCETNQIEAIVENYQLNNAIPTMTIQENGGVAKTITHGIQAVKTLLPIANQAERTPQPISELMVALQCGGSDGWSGVTANVLVGRVSDELVRNHGTVVLGETPEIYGAEHLLTRRAANQQVAEKLIEKVRWWENYTRINDMEIDNNPTVGNKVGGLTTIYEKSLGAVAKGGTTPLTAVFDYAEPVTTRGFTFMDSPGYDPVSVTGQVAGGCNLVLFTTGRGSAFGFKPAPSIKISTNTRTYAQMTDDMDFDAGVLLGDVSSETVTKTLLDLMIAVASGQQSKSEAQGIGESEFNPWHIGATM